MSEKNPEIIIEKNERGLYFIPSETVPTASFIQFTSFITGSSSESILVSSSLFVSRSELVAASASFFLEQDPDDKTAIQFRIPSSSTTGLTKELLPIYISGSGRVGVGTKDPKTQFDIRSDDDSSEGTKLLLRSTRGVDNALQVGDSAGEIDFVVESGSFNNIETSGSIGRIKGIVTSVNATGATGKIVIAVAKGTQIDSSDIVDWKYVSDATLGSNFAQIMSASLLIKDHSTTLLSKFQIRKHDHTLYMAAESGSLYVKETGSFGLIEGGTF